MGIWKRRPWSLRTPPAPRPPAASAPGPPAEFLEPPSSVRALLDRESEVRGKLRFAGPARIDGRLRGEVRGSGMLVIGESGHVDGSIYASTLLVLGQVDGEVQAVERVEVGPTGSVRGRVETRALIVHPGAAIDGDCRVAPPRASVHVLRPAEQRGDASPEG